MFDFIKGVFTSLFLGGGVTQLKTTGLTALESIILASRLLGSFLVVGAAVAIIWSLIRYRKELYFSRFNNLVLSLTCLHTELMLSKDSEDDLKNAVVKDLISQTKEQLNKKFFISKIDSKTYKLILNTLSKVEHKSTSHNERVALVSQLINLIFIAGKLKNR